MSFNREILFPGKSFAKQVTTLALPVFLQNLITFLLGIMDVVLLQGKGDIAVAAVSIANQAYFCITLLIFGISSGSSVLISQFRGGRDLPAMRKVVVISIGVAAVLMLPFLFFFAVFPATALKIMTSEPELIAAGAAYVRIVSPSFIFSGISLVFAALLRCNDRPKLPLFASVTAIATNTILNYILIYGKLGFPEMGISGAAVATVISRLLEMILILSFVYLGNEPNIKISLKDARGISRAHMNKFFVIALPVIFNEFAWGLCNTAYAAIYGRMGTVTVAAMSVANVIHQAFATLPNSIGYTTAIILGHLLGAGKFDQAKSRAHTLSIYSILLGMIMGSIMIVCSPFFTNTMFGSLSIEATTMACSFITVFACYLPLQNYLFTMIAGILRSGGDTTFGAFLDVAPMLLIGIPLGIIFGVILKLNPVLVVALMYTDGIVKAVVGFFRVLTYKWVRKIESAK